ncbi:Hcp family type VI secretion system effector [Candidatus Venteria ishoeyi]|uniref:Major exported protein n=1 Tax=Candidatus Venteria ishoeyi TaxID=1899563 RepID=A0A1H6FEC3_9GAMM|nr:type VI secretion system tube protein Hcp [Candidatus Venteria ishoeyi]MDM8546838.1 type VI secretion system tube protein Hcp [Candidatus Venteria ishoeyi]SEH08428.1 Uncharacterised protein [Candidatus Venteria ishoeyi]
MASNIYLKIYPTGKSSDFFQGNSQDTNHNGQIELDSWSHSFEQPVSAATKSSELGPSARCNHEALTFSKFYDNSTDNLMKACWIGQCLDAEFYLYRPLEGGPEVLTEKQNRYLKITTKNCYLKSMSISGEAEEIAKEELTLIYNYIQYGFREIDLFSGKLKNATEAIDWYWTTNLITSTPTHE